MERVTAFILGILVLSFLIAAFYYPQAPESMVSHWNIRGEPDGFMPRFWGIFLFPLVFVGMGLLFIAIPRIDPMKENIGKFRNYYDGLIVVFFLFMVSVYVQTILWNVGIMIDIALTVPLGVGLLFIYIGFMLDKTKRNWFIGIRTPWTLSSDRVWKKTHRVGGRLFKASGVLAIVGVAFRDYSR